MKRKFKKHSDKNFVRGFGRYLCIDYVLDSASWSDLFKKVELHDRKDFIKQSFDEYRLFNLVMVLEQRMATILELFFNEGKLDKKKAFGHISGLCKKYRRIDKKKADKLLLNEIDGNESNIFSPYILFYVAGCCFGDLVNIFDEYTETFTTKDRIIIEMKSFKDKRNDFIHKLLSSRVNSKMLLQGALRQGIKIRRDLDKMVQPKRISDEMILKLNLEI